ANTRPRDASHPRSSTSGAGASATFAAMETYFTFPDGALRYDCASCRQRCCRGKGFAFTGDELVPLLRRAPSLAAHLELRAGGAFGAVDLTERCWFLQDDGWCRLEVEHGRAAKP